MDNFRESILTKIQKADLVLVGIGEEMEADLLRMQEDKKYAEFLEKIAANKDWSWMIPYVEKLYMEEHRDRRIEEAYTALEAMLEGKNYFIVSTCTDDYIYAANLNRERIVTPCGGYRMRQCAANCNHQVCETDRDIIDRMRYCLQGEEAADALSEPVCGDCGGALVFNNVKAESYAEEGYMEQWNKYTKWLQGTLNKQLCVLELGVGMRFPTVIRWPFEKIVMLNQKAYLFRIHGKLYQVSEEIKSKSASVKQNSIDFLNKGFV